MKILNRLKIVISYGIVSVLTSFICDPVLSQSTCSNYWINPSSSKKECFDLSQPTYPRTTRNIIPRNCNDLELEIETVELSGSDRAEVFGTVKNNSKYKYENIIIHLHYLQDNKIVEEEFTSLTPYTLYPGKIGTWEDSTYKNRVNKIEIVQIKCTKVD